MNQAEYFFVTSYGRTATLWLTRALNLHQNVACSHGSSIFPIIARQGIAIDNASIVDSQNVSQTFFWQPFTKIFADIDRCKKGRWVGNVHGFSANSLFFKRWTELNVPPFRTVNLIRHPITRIDSLCKRWEYERSFDSPISRWIAAESIHLPQFQSTLKELRSYYDVALDNFYDRAFFYAVMLLTTDDRDLRINTHHILSEQLVSDIDYYTHTLRLLLGDKIDISKSYLNDVQKLGKQNASKEGGHSAEQVFKEWQPWQRTLFLMLLRDYPALKTKYLRFGYDLPSSNYSDIRIATKSHLTSAFDTSSRYAGFCARGIRRLINNKLVTNPYSRSPIAYNSALIRSDQAVTD